MLGLHYHEPLGCGECRSWVLAMLEAKLDRPHEDGFCSCCGERTATVYDEAKQVTDEVLP